MKVYEPVNSGSPQDRQFQCWLLPGSSFIVLCSFIKERGIYVSLRFK